MLIYRILAPFSYLSLNNHRDFSTQPQLDEAVAWRLEPPHASFMTTAISDKLIGDRAEAAPVFDPRAVTTSSAPGKSRPAEQPHDIVNRTGCGIWH